MQYVHQVDLKAIEATNERTVKVLTGGDPKEMACKVSFCKNPVGSGTRPGRGLHTHPADHFYYIISGTMRLEIDGAEYMAHPGSLVVMPAGVPHQNWTHGSEAVVYVAIAAPGDVPSH